MLNYIWAVMIVIAVVYGAATGNMAAVGDGAISSAKEAVELCITMTGVMSMWMGIMEVAGNAGVIQKLENLLSPFIGWMFPNIDRGSAATEHITTNIIANILGLGWAATPAGLRAMEEMAVPDDDTATDEMCTFLVLNVSSLQLIPVNIIAYRSQYGAMSPTEIVAPAIVATTIGTLVGVVFCKIMCKKNKIIESK